MSDMPQGAGERLVRFIEQIENIEEDRAALALDARQIYGEAKSEGFDPKIMRKVIMLRRKSRAEADEERTLLEVYLEAVGFGEADPIAGDMRGEDGVANWVSDHAHPSGTA